MLIASKRPCDKSLKISRSVSLVEELKHHDEMTSDVNRKFVAQCKLACRALGQTYGRFCEMRRAAGLVVDGGNVTFLSYIEVNLMKDVSVASVKIVKAIVEVPEEEKRKKMQAEKNNKKLGEVRVMCCRPTSRTAFAVFIMKHLVLDSEDRTAEKQAELESLISTAKFAEASETLRAIAQTLFWSTHRDASPYVIQPGEENHLLSEYKQKSEDFQQLHAIFADSRLRPGEIWWNLVEELVKIESSEHESSEVWFDECFAINLFFRVNAAERIGHLMLDKRRSTWGALIFLACIENNRYFRFRVFLSLSNDPKWQGKTRDVMTQMLIDELTKAGIDMTNDELVSEVIDCASRRIEHPNR